MSNNNLPDGRPNEPFDFPVPVPPTLRAPTIAASSGGEDISRFFAAIMRHKWIVIIAGVVGLGAGIGASQFVKPTYVTQGTIWIEGEEGNGRGNMGPILAGQLLNSFAWVQLLKSFQVMDYVVNEEKLFVHARSPQYQWAFKDITLKDRFRPGSYRLAVLDNSTW